MKQYVKLLKSIRSIFAVFMIFLLVCCYAEFTLAAKRDKEYVAKQISNLKIDGKITEWQRAEKVAFDEIKDVGDRLPNAKDFKGEGRVAWSASDPSRIYFLIEITDDKLQDINPWNNKWWEDDSVELMFDFDNDILRDSLVQWTIGANGEDLSAAASEENTEWELVVDGTNYIYEIAVDASAARGPNPGNANKGKDFKAEEGLTIGLSFHYNDCENGNREHQIGWMPGQAWDPVAFGDLTFDREFLAVEPTGKLALTWGALKQ